MDFRATLNNHPRTTVGIVIGLVVLVLAITASSWLHAGRHGQPAPGAFYTDDDGQTLFTDIPALVTPFDHNGKPAVKTMVFTADHGQHQWVQYLQKYSDASARKFSTAVSAHVAPTPDEIVANMPDVLVKKPGAEKWIASTDPAGRALMQPTIPNGMGSGPIELAPR